MIAAGQTLRTDFRLTVCERGAKRIVTFAELLTRRTIVSVYMRNNTPSCDCQNEELARHAAEFESAGYTLVAVSRDTCGSHARYAAAKNIGYVLVSDPDDHFAQAADAIVEKSMYGRSFQGPARAAFIIDRDGMVLAVIEKVDPKHHAAQVRNAIATLG